MKKFIYVLMFLAFVSSVSGQWQTDVRLTNNPGFSLTTWNNSRCIASNGNIVHVFFSDNRDGNSEIYYKRSTDAGVNWGADTRLTNNVDSSAIPSVAVSGSTVHLVWNDKRDGNFEIYYKRSTDDGLSWGSDIRLTNSLTVSGLPSLAVSGSVLHLVWEESNFSSNYGILYKRSTDGGVSWGTEVELASYSYTRAPSIAVAGSTVHVVWINGTTPSYNIFYKRSSDAGLTWVSSTQISTNSSQLWNPPSVAVSGSSVHVAWNFSLNNIWSIYYKRSTDAGLTWGTDNWLINGISGSIFPNIAASGTLAHIVWFDSRNTSLAIYYKRSVNNGNNWEADTRLTLTDSMAVAPSIALSGNTVHVVWADKRNDNFEIYYKRNPTGNTIGIKNISAEIPSGYSLSQNYPNPFNPTTNIRYQITNNKLVTLKIFDVIGKEVETLVNEKLAPGTYEATFDGSNLTSGVYFYRLTTEGFSETKKMILIK
jgi:hypothetical protein